MCIEDFNFKNLETLNKHRREGKKERKFLLSKHLARMAKKRKKK